jgi:hypothetical protein
MLQTKKSTEKTCYKTRLPTWQYPINHTPKPLRRQASSAAMASSTPSVSSPRPPINTNSPPNSTPNKPGEGEAPPLGSDLQCEILIIGAGAAGLLAALRAHLHSLKPLLIEKTSFLGGTSALSGGSVWIPNNHITLSAGIQDSVPNALSYMNATIGDVGPVSSLERKMAFLTHGPKMVQCLSDIGFKWVAAPK